MDTFPLYTSFTDAMYAPPSKNVVLLCLSLTFAILGIYLVSMAFEWEFYFFLVLFCVVVFVLAFIRFDMALLFVPLTLTNPYTLKQTGTNLHISEVVLLILFSVWFLRLFLSKEHINIPKKTFIPAVIIVLSAIVSLFVANYLAAGIQQVVRYIEILLIFFLVVVQNYKDEEKIRILFLFLIIGGLFASFLGIWQFITGDLTRGVTRRVFGWHGGGYGALIASTLILSVSALFYKRQRIIQIWALITIPFSGLALVLSQTRAWIGALFLVSCIMLLLMKRKYIKKIFIAGLIVLGLTALIFMTNAFGFIEDRYFKAAINTAFKFGFASKSSADNISLFMRLNVWREAAIQYIHHPFTGIGVGNLRISNYFFARLGRPTEGMGYIDNQYIQFFTEIGTVAGIVWIIYLFQALQGGLQSVRRTAGTLLYAPAIGFFSCLLVFTIGSFFWVITSQHELFALLILYIALLSNIGVMSKQDEAAGMAIKKNEYGNT
jgi:O-antigen ligase